MRMRTHKCMDVHAHSGTVKCTATVAFQATVRTLDLVQQWFAQSSGALHSTTVAPVRLSTLAILARWVYSHGGYTQVRPSAAVLAEVEAFKAAHFDGKFVVGVQVG
jgi:hypothetical protein